MQNMRHEGASAWSEQRREQPSSEYRHRSLAPMAPSAATRQLQFVQDPVLSSARECSVPEDGEHDAQHAGALAAELYGADHEAASLNLGVYRPLELPGLLSWP